MDKHLKKNDICSVPPKTRLQGAAQEVHLKPTQPAIGNVANSKVSHVEQSQRSRQESFAKDDQDPSTTFSSPGRPFRHMKKLFSKRKTSAMMIVTNSARITDGDQP